MNQILVAQLSPNMYFSSPVWLDDKYSLLTQNTPVSDNLIRRLKKWGYSGIQSQGLPTEKPANDSAILSDSGTVSLNQDLKEQEGLRDAARFFGEMLNFTEKIFTDFVTKNELSLEDISDRIKEIIEKIRSRRNYILRLSDMRSLEKNYIVIHSVKTAILSLAVGIQLKMPPHKLIELGMAALLHEIGMIRLPPQLYMSNRILASEEKRAITAHTILGFKILKSFSFPMPVCSSILEHHEHLDGKGYPRGLMGDRISIPAKIIAVCGSYSALISKRPYRSGMEGHAAILELLKERGKHYDEEVLKALIFCLSIYPVGGYVTLADGSMGMVVETNLENPRAPTVKVLIAQGGGRLKDSIMVNTGDKETQIVRALSKAEILLINPNAAQDFD